MFAKKLFQITVFAMAAGAFSAGQSTINIAPRPQLRRPCQRVWIKSQSSVLSAVLISEKLGKRPEFTSAGLTLSNSEDEADLFVIVSGDEHDTTISALQRGDNNTAGAKVVALAEFPGIIAGKIVDTLHELCPSISTAGRWYRFGLQTLIDTTVLQIASAKSLTIVSETSAIDDRQVARSLRRDPQVQEWGIVVNSGNGYADLRLEITRDLRRTIVWKYELFNASGESLLVGWTAAYAGEHAAQAIMRRVLQQFTRCRSNADSSPRAETNNERQELRNARIYDVNLVTDDPRTTGTPLHLIFDQGVVLGRNNLGQTIFKIEALDLEDVNAYTIRDPILDGAADLAESLPDPATPAMAGAEGGLVLASMGAAMLVAPFVPKAHLIDLVWSDGEDYQSATVQVKTRDVRSILRALHAFQSSSQPGQPIPLG